jgi:starch phosphorylase
MRSLREHGAHFTSHYIRRINMTANEYIKVRFGRNMNQCTNEEIYIGLLEYVKDKAKNKEIVGGKKKLYYISAEFLIGKLLSNNLINLGIYDEVKVELAEAGKDITDLEEFEYEPSLGNGGLGRLAACFIDSLATLGLPADGVGLAYHCGLFKQSFEDNKQHARPDYWRKWGMANWMRRTDRHYKVQCGDLELVSTMYEIDVTGYGSKCGRLRLFDLDTVNERLIGSGIDFDKEEIEKNLTLFLYPDDSDEAGRMLRVYQEYFMVSNAAQLIIDECVERGSDLHDLADPVVENLVIFGRVGGQVVHGDIVGRPGLGQDMSVPVADGAAGSPGDDCPADPALESFLIAVSVDNLQRIETGNQQHTE